MQQYNRRDASGAGHCRGEQAKGGGGLGTAEGGKLDIEEDDVGRKIPGGADDAQRVAKVTEAPARDDMQGSQTGR